VQAGIELSVKFFHLCVLARPNKTNGANGKKSAFLAQKDLQMRKRIDALLCCRGIVACHEQHAVFLHRAWRDRCAYAREMLCNPCACPVQDQRRIGVLL